MTTSVSVNDKMRFLQWFTNNFNIKDWESFRIIQCFINDPTLLTNISFVRNANYCPRSLLITIPSSKELLFHYSKQGMTVRDKEKIFHDIRFHKHEALYLQLKFHKAYQSPEYVSVLEANPYAPSTRSMTQEENHLVEQLFIESHYNYKKDKLKQQVDKSLDDKDFERFLTLSNKLSLLERNNNSNH